jgi:opacity protein-like surface antigen
MAFRSGVAIGRTLLYAKCGVGMYSMGFKGTEIAEDFLNGVAVNGGRVQIDAKSKKWTRALIVGLGIDVNVSKNIVVGFLSEMNFCKGKKVKSAVGGVPVNNVKITQNTRFMNNMLVVRYKIPAR